MCFFKDVKAAVLISLLWLLTIIQITKTQSNLKLEDFHDTVNDKRYFISFLRQTDPLKAKEEVIFPLC